MLDSASIEKLINGCRKDSWQHKERLYKSYYGYIKAVIVRYINNFHEAEELINDSFLKIFNNLSQFNYDDSANDVELSFRSWIGRIASRTAIDFLRKKNTEFKTDEISENHVPVQISNNDFLNSAKDIIKILNTLPDTYRAVFNMYVVEGFSHEEISKILGISESVSRVYLSRAKNKLKDLYIKHFNES